MNQDEKLVSRITQFEDYRDEITKIPVFYDVIWDSDKEVLKFLKKFKKFFPQEYRFFLKDMLAITTETKSRAFKVEEGSCLESFSEEMKNELQSFKAKEVAINRFLRVDFSLHLNDNIISNIQTDQKGTTAELFSSEFGILRKGVKKLTFSNVKKNRKMGRINVAIDGVAGAGKSTIAKLIANKFNYQYIDTGLMYRTVAYLAKIHNLLNQEPKQIVKKYLEHKIVFKKEKVFINEVDVSREVRTTEIASLASKIAKLPEIRELLTRQQRNLAKSKGVIMDGRDIGSRVLRNAELKLYFTANPMIRAKRRIEQNKAQGFNEDFKEVLAKINERDKADLTRKLAPLIKAKGAISLDTSDFSVEDTINKVIKLVETAIEDQYLH